MGYLLPEERARCNKSRRDKELQVSSNASPVLERQSWRAAVCPRLVRRGNKEEEQGVEMKRSNAAVARLQPQWAGTPAERGSCAVPERGRGQHGPGEAVCGVSSTRGFREGARGGMSQPHLPSINRLKAPLAPLLDVQTSRWGAWLRRPAHQAGARGAHARLPLVLCWHGRRDSTSVRPQNHCLPWGDGNYGQAFVLWGARSCVMLCECRRVVCASDVVSAGPMALWHCVCKTKQMSTKALPFKFILKNCH